MKRNETQITTIIGMHAECNGDFAAEGAIRVDGTINGRSEEHTSELQSHAY